MMVSMARTRLLSQQERGRKQQRERAREGLELAVGLGLGVGLEVIVTSLQLKCTAMDRYRLIRASV